jgi:Fic family protein
MRQRAIGAVDETLSTAIAKACFWSRFGSAALNERQIKVLNRLVDSFEGKNTTFNWATIAKCSQDTAHRDIPNLIEQGSLPTDSVGGRSTSYPLHRE